MENVKNILSEDLAIDVNYLFSNPITEFNENGNTNLLKQSLKIIKTAQLLAEFDQGLSVNDKLYDISQIYKTTNSFNAVLSEIETKNKIEYKYLKEMIDYIDDSEITDVATFEVKLLELMNKLIQRYKDEISSN